ncbi:MAG TPA: hypothetical protein V6D43_23410 [Candidatus Sericytochromatia bacterium]
MFDSTASTSLLSSKGDRSFRHLAVSAAILDGVIPLFPLAGSNWNPNPQSHVWFPVGVMPPPTL